MNRPFSDLSLEDSYFSGLSGANLIAEFYEPVLERAVTYDRVAGYFSSASLAAVARGIAAFLENGGKMRLVTSHAFTRGDVTRLQEVAQAEALEAQLIDDFAQSVSLLDGLGSAIAKDHFSAMCWMLANDKLEIKVVIPRNADLTQLTPTEIEKFHPKFGVLKDRLGNKIAFSGSVNETRFAWTKNEENMDVYQSWLPGRESYIRLKELRFERYWNEEEDENWLTLSLPDAVKEKVVGEYAPDDLPASVTEKAKSVIHDFGLSRQYQNTAVGKWVNNDYRGILEMATGTGKTRTAKTCIDEAGKTGRLLTIVVVPYRHIGEQWMLELAERKPIFVAGKWREELGKIKAEAALGRLSSLTLVVVKNTAATGDFVANVGEIAQRFEHCLLVGDEVHWLGAPSLQKSLVEFADYRLGLSATPRRYFDEAGSELLETYFDGIVFRFPIENALAAKDSDGNRILTPYNYHPVFVELTEEESQEYWAYTRQILAIKDLKNKSPEDLKRLEDLYLFRAEIGKNAENKVPRLRELLQDFPLKLEKTLLYCSNFEQMTAVQEVLANFRIFPQKVTGDESTGPSRKFNNKSERQHIIDSFEEGNLDVLLAIDCLDEGVDIPSARVGIILASSGNEKEFVQRRGRLMRVSPGKEVAEIFDFCVIPSAEKSHQGIGNLVRVELNRIAEFAEVALNRAEVLEMIQSRMGGDSGD